MRRYLVGRSPFAIKHFTYVHIPRLRGEARVDGLLLRAQRHRAGAVGHRRQGRGQPVYNLLGGRAASGCASTPTAGPRAETRTRRRAGAAAGEDGLHRAQVRPVPRPVARVHRPARRGRRPSRRCARCARRSGRTSTSWSRCIGGWRRPTRSAWRDAGAVPPVLVRGAGLVAQTWPGWRRSDASIPLPVVTGEELYTQGASSADVFAQRAADIINPDVCNCGGILEMKRDRRDGRAEHVGRRRTTTTAPRLAWPRHFTPRRESRTS